MTESLLSTVDEALQAYSQGRMIIVVDDEDRENEGDLVLAPEFATPEAINFMVTHGRGLVCLAMRGSLLDRLQIPMMVPQAQNRSGFGTGFTLSVEAVHGVSTGISAEDRAVTIKTLIDARTTPADIAMPGHIFPLRARDGGVLESVEQLVQHRLALGQGNMATAVKKIADATPSSKEPLVIEIGRSHLPTEYGVFDIVVFRDQQGLEHSALIQGDVTQGSPLVRLHSECLTGDAFGSLRCDCGPQLQSAMQRIGEQQCGAIIYLRQEGRGIGLGNKIRAYELQDKGVDTVDANQQLGFPADARNYDIAAEIVKSLNIGNVTLMSNNPVKHDALVDAGIPVHQRQPLVTGTQVHNEKYLQTKALRMGHNYNDDK